MLLYYLKLPSTFNRDGRGRTFNPSTLKALGYKTSNLIRGFSILLNILQAKLGIDEVHANILDVQDRLVTGEVKVRSWMAHGKTELLRQLADKMGISLEPGDGCW